jgi:hypothetical protein
MFKKNKCPQCEEKISKKFEFCPYCGFKLTDNSSEDYGFLGKNDMDKVSESLPFGFGALMKPLMKELSKQMAQLDRELKKDSQNDFKKPNFSINFLTPGHKPIKIQAISPGFNVRKPVKKNQPVLQLPKISEDKLKKMKKLEKVEPKTSVRRLSDSVVYEIDLPDVNNLGNVNISKFEDSVEIKAFSDKIAYEKDIDINLPLINYSLDDFSLILEFGTK